MREKKRLLIALVICMAVAVMVLAGVLVSHLRHQASRSEVGDIIVEPRQREDRAEEPEAVQDIEETQEKELTNAMDQEEEAAPEEVSEPEIAEAETAERETPEEEAVAEPESEPEPEEETPKKLIVIDAGHQRKGNNEKEPIGPGASETKAKVSGGTSGVSTGRPEYEVVLEVALKLQTELEDRGYEVLMVRTTNDVNISNSERAAVANDNHADAFIRIHIDGAEDSSVTGAHTICQTPNNKYNGNLYNQSKALASCVLNEYVAATGCRKRVGGDGVSERDDLSGINWCQVPATLIELGFMTNPNEDELMSSADYQKKMVAGIANGIDAYFML